MTRYKATIAYDGTRYAGWQLQPDQPTVQHELEKALAEITGEAQRIHSSGRTDSGVHAIGQVAHFDLEATCDARKLREGLNALIEADIRVVDLEEACPEFHARYDAKSKEYRYLIWNERVLSPIVRHYRAHVISPLNEVAMQEAAQHLVGKHDFAAFSANPNREIDGTVRHVMKLDVARDGSEIAITAVGNGFLYKMVRSLAGFLIRVGTGELAVESAAVILESKERTARVPTAHPQGLFLWQVNYE